MDRKRRGAGMPAPPVRSKAPPVRRQVDRSKDQKVKSSSSVPAMTRSSMLVMEANEIAQILKKDYEFKMEEEVQGDENLTRVQVHQKKLGISCVWTLAKLKLRLVKMRKLMYADEVEGQGFGCETVFFDPKDVWVRDEDTKTPTNENQATDIPNNTGESESQSDKENVVPNGHLDDRRQSHGLREENYTLSNETVLPSVSESVALENTRDMRSGPPVTPPNHNSNNNQHQQPPTPTSLHNNSTLSMNSSSELPADSEFLTLSMTSSPMSPPLPPKDFGEHSGVLPHKYLVKPGSIDQKLASKNPQQPPPHSGNHDNTANSSATADPQHSKYTPIIKTRSPNTHSSSGNNGGSKKSKKKDAGISFNLDMQKSPQKTGSLLKDRTTQPAPRIGTSNNWVAVKPRSDDGKAVSKGNQMKSGGHQENNHHSSAVLGRAGGENHKQKAFVCEKCGGGDRSRGDEKKVAKKGISMLRICRDMVKTLAFRSKGPVRQDLLVDRILYNAEVIKVAVINILEAYTQAQDAKHDMAMFADSELIKLTSMQLVAAMELLVSHSSLWATSFAEEQEEGTSLVRDICLALHSSVKDLGKEMVLFLQACESDQDWVASETSTKIIEELYDLVRCCGELGMATETCPQLLLDKPEQGTLENLRDMRQQREDDLLHMKPSEDLKEAFVAGSDLWTDRHLDSSVQAVAQCQKQAQILSEDCMASQCSEQVAKQIYITVGTIRIMTLKYQDIQVEIASDLKADQQRGDNYFYHYFLRSQGLLTHLTTLLDSLTLLLQAAQPLVDEEEAGVLKKVWRCAEMVHNATVKLSFASNMDQSKSFLQSSFSSTSSLNGLSLEMNLPKLKGMSAVVSELQCDEIQQCAEDVKLATHGLIAVIKKRLPKSSFGGGVMGGSGKVKRMLPATPGAGTGRPMLRCKSAKTHERIRRSQSYYDVSEDLM